MGDIIRAMDFRSVLWALFVLLFAGSALAENPIDLVDPFIGVRGAGSCVPGPCLPNGSIHPSPDTDPPDNGGYISGESPKIVGFSQLHVQGTGGTRSYGNFLLTPRIGYGPAAPMAKSDEIATVSSYQVRLGADEAKSVFCEVAPTAHCAIYRFTYPKTNEATLILDVGRKLDLAAAMTKGSVKINHAAGTITGGGRFEKNWNPAPYDLYFAMKVSKAPVRSGTWVGNKRQPGVYETSVGSAKPIGAYMQWSTTAGETLSVKIAVSFLSVKQAENYLKDEIPAWDISAVKKNAASQWTKKLALAKVEGGTLEDRKKFYTALYHTMIQPRDRTGDFAAFSKTAPMLDDQYTLWDTWRTEYPLMAIIRPDWVADAVNSILARHAKNGRVGAAFIQGREMLTAQGGDEADIVVADAFVKGIKGVDWKKAYEFLRYDALQSRTPEYRWRGYCSYDALAESQKLYDKRFCPAGSTLAFAYSDFCVSQVALGLGFDDDARVFRNRSANWKRLWDIGLEETPFKGFVHNRYASGKFVEKMGKTIASPREGWNTDFYEGTPWIYSFFVPQDFEGMVGKMGGKDRFVNRLQYAVDNELIDFTNEPSFLTLAWFSAAGRPDLAAFYADQLRAKFTTEGYPGDEDSGAMSSLYVFLSAGFLPVAGQDIYYLIGPGVPQVSFDVGGGKRFSVKAQNAGGANIYIQSATLNGKPLAIPVITHKVIKSGGTLELVMGNMPTTWGRF